MKKPKEITLEDRLKASIAQATPSIAPAGAVKKEAGDGNTPPKDVREIISNAKDRLTFLRLAQESAELGKESKAIEKRREGVTAQLKILCAKYNVEAARAGDTNVSYYSSTKSTLNKEKLIKAGVQPSVIVSCTDHKTSWTLRVTACGEANDEE